MSVVLARRVRRYVQRAVLVNYAARLVSVVLVVAFILGMGVYLGGKWAMTASPYGHPVTLFHAGEALIILAVLFFFAWPKLRYPETVETMAARLEKADAELNECLSSALEFHSPDPLLAECLEISSGILPAFYEDTVRRIRARNRWMKVIPWYFWFSLVLFGGFLLFWANLYRFEPVTGQDMWAAYRENFLVNPYRPLHTLEITPGFSQILRGDSVKVTANLMGPGEHTAVIRYSMAGFPLETAEMKPKAPGLNVFEFEFENLQRDLTYQIEAGPLTSLEYTVTVRDPPELTYIQLTYFFPGFTGRNVEAMPPGQGAARAPVGTTVEVSTRWNRPMAAVFMSVNENEREPLEKRGSYWKRRFVIQTSGRYLLSGSSEEGVPVRRGLEFPIEVINDTPPAIEWIWPKEDLDLSDKKDRTAKVPLVYRVEDDYGIQSIYLYAGAPGRATDSYEIANLDGKQRTYRQTYDFPIRSWGNVPVIRIYLMANDNHPQIPNQTPTEVRRLYLQPPGTFDESEDATDELRVKTDPFELTALELFYLIKLQRSQNETFNEKTQPESEEEWFNAQEQLVRMTSRTVLRVKDRIRQVRYGQVGEQAESRPDIVGVPSASSEGETGVSDLATRLEEVIARLAGGFERLDRLQPGMVPDGDSVLDHQLRQADAAGNSRRRRSREEGERALRELEAAFRELTGKNPPRSIEEAEKDLEEEKKKEDEESSEEEEKNQTEDEENEDEEFDFGEGDEEIVKGLDDQEGETGMGEEEEEKQELGGASLPTNVYSPSQYTLDPDTVTLDSPASRLLRRALAENLSGLDLSEYRKYPIPPEYRKIAEQYNQALLGE